MQPAGYVPQGWMEGENYGVCHTLTKETLLHAGMLDCNAIVTKLVMTLIFGLAYFSRVRRSSLVLKSVATLLKFFLWVGAKFPYL